MYSVFEKMFHYTLTSLKSNFPHFSVLIVGADRKEGNGIFVFHDDANGELTLERKIELNKSFGDPLRAVEVLSPSGLECPQYLVSHVSYRGVLGIKSDHRISRITNDTEVMACYGVGVGNELQQLRNPDCIYVDANGMILVVDTGTIEYTCSPLNFNLSAICWTRTEYRDRPTSSWTRRKGCCTSHK